MLPEQIYHEGFFTIPPRFDFKILPLKTRRITVVSFIGECDTFLGEKPQLNVPCHTFKPVVTGADLAEPYLDGYYDCERQMVFLTMNNLRLEGLLHQLSEKKCGVEELSTLMEYNQLKLLYYIFIVSHFVVVSDVPRKISFQIRTIGTHFDPRYINIFKLLSKINLKMLFSVDACIRTLPLPREWLNSCRASIPRLLFVFKLPIHMAMKLDEDRGAVRELERNLVNQIFNTFYETGLTSSTSGNQLFILPGHNFVHVLLGNQYASASNQKTTIHDGDLAQEYLESIIDDMGFGHLCSKQETNRAKHIRTCLNPSDLKFEAPPEHTAWEYPPPDQPEEHTFSAFLHLHVSTMLDQLASRTGSFTQTSPVHELPTCKGWFMACYKLYTSLMADDALPSVPETTTNSEPIGEEELPPTSLAQAWHRALMSLVHPKTVRPSGMSCAVGQEAPAETDLPVKDAFRQQLLRIDPLYRLSEIRCKAAAAAAELHYKQDLPVHYSNTYHMIKVVSAFNVVTSLARGPLVFPTLERLSKRLAHIYLAGRVTCSMVSLSGLPCQHELHRVPDEVANLRTILLPSGTKDATVESTIVSNSSSGMNREANTLLENLVPVGLAGRWKLYWLQSLLVEGPTSAIKVDETSTAKSDGAVDESSVCNQPNGQENDETTQHLTVLPHRSDLVMISACSCGRQQADRPDPFDYLEANWRFYSVMARLCCNELTSIPLAPQFLCESGHPFSLPVDPSEMSTTQLSQQGQDASGFNKTSASAPVAVLTRRMAALEVGRRNDSLHSGDNLSPQELSLNQPDPADADLSQPDVQFMIPSPSELEDQDLKTDEPLNDYKNSSVEDEESDSNSTSASSRISRTGDLGDSDTEQPLAGYRRLPERDELPSEPPSPEAGSTEEAVASSLGVRFRDGVPSSDWMVGDIPRYPSWSIHALGKYFSYSHSSGLSCRGFLRGSNFLLPWDVTISASAWAASERSGRRAGRGGKYRGRSDFDTVKLFIGFEMECPQGHRFFLAGPDRAMDGPMQSGQVRRAVHGLLTRDLPLFMPCRCRASQSTDPLRPNVAGQADWDSSVSKTNTATGRPSVYAQLTRIYLAIPSAPIRVRFQPRIRPGAVKDAPIFHMGHTLDQCSEGSLEASSDSEQENTAYDESDDFENDAIDNRPLEYKRRNRRPVKCPSLKEKKQSPGFVLLENGYLWVVRLPFAYHDESQLYRRPQQYEQLKQWSLLKGSIKLEV